MDAEQRRLDQERILGLLMARWIKNPRATMNDAKDIASELGMDLQHTYAMLDLLRAQGLVQETGRRHFAITEAGVLRSDSHDLERMRAMRSEVLRHVYRRSGHVKYADFTLAEVAPEVGMDVESLTAIVEYLDDEGLLEWTAMGGRFGITHRGRLEVEELIARPDAPTEHFPALIIHGNNNQVQIGSHGSGQSQTAVTYEVQDVEAFLSALRSTDLPDDVIKEAEVIEAAIRREHAKGKGASFNTIASYLRGLSGTIVQLATVSKAASELWALWGDKVQAAIGAAETLSHLL